MINSVSIGKIIKRFRNKNNLTQEELAEKIDISKNYLSKVERGLSKLNVESFLKMSQVLMFTLEDFGVKIQHQDSAVKQEIIKTILISSQKEADIYLQMMKLMNTFRK